MNAKSIVKKSNSSLIVATTIKSKSNSIKSISTKPIKPKSKSISKLINKSKPRRRKATNATEVVKFTDIPNVGPSIANDFALLGIELSQLKNQDAFELYQRLFKLTKTRQDPCVLDTFMAVVDFMNGGESKPWFEFTKKRKQLYGQVD